MATRSKLAVILHADVVGSTALVQADERLAHERIRKAFEQFSVTIARYGGTAHEVRGDALVAEFNRASDAVTASLAFQVDNRSHNESLSSEVRPEVRVGIALGEVIIADQTVTGAGVVLAQRLEQLAKQGAVCLQGSVRESVPKRFPFEYEDLGSQSLKGFDEPVQAFSVALRPGESLPAPDVDTLDAESFVQKRRWHGAIVIAALVIVLSGVAVWLQPWKQAPDLPSSSPAQEISTGRTVEAESLTPQETGGDGALPLADKPSIAVLAFSNMSKDPDQDFFADGIAEDIITDLSKISGLTVISRNSSFSYKGKNVSVKAIARELGVKYVLEGSVRRAGGTLRITAQLIDASTESHLWAERYDGSVTDVFGLQDAVTSKVVAALAVTLDPEEQRHVHQETTRNLKAYEAYLRGMRLLTVKGYASSRSEIVAASEEFQSAIALDPEYALAYAGLAWALWIDYAYHNWHDRGPRLAAFEMADRSLALNENWLGYVVRSKRFLVPDVHFPGTPEDHDSAVAELRRAVALAPNNPDALTELAVALAFSGEHAEAAELMSRTKRLNPNVPGHYYRAAGIVSYLNGDYADAVREFIAWHASEAIPTESVFWLAAALAESGDIARAREMLEALFARRGRPFYLQSVERFYAFKKDEDRTRFVDSLRKAGMPDGND